MRHVGFAIDEVLVGRLVAEQFPEWVGLPLSRVRSDGTDNVMYRLGPDLVVRLPRIAGTAEAVDVEQRWLPGLASVVPLAVPVPVGRGVPGRGYPCPWSVYRWLDGENALDAPPADLADAAVRLGRFVTALWRFDAAGGPPSFRGGPVGDRDDQVRTAIQDLGADGTVDPGVATAAWQTALEAAPWGGPPVWVHSDLHPANLLTRGGRLTGVVDFGGLGMGDPACDLLPAWTMLTADTRDRFRAEVDVDDDATWARGRGWGLRFGLGALHYYRATNPTLGAIGQHALTQILAYDG